MADEAVPQRDGWRQLNRVTGIAGILAAVLIFAPIIAISTLGEPGFDATGEQAAQFFRNGDTVWVAAAQATAAIGMLAFLWFVVALTILLRRVEVQPAWRSSVALASGVLVAAYGVIDASWDAAFNRGSELDPGVALFAFDLGNLGFANAWIALGSFALSTGWVLLVGRWLPRWWGWWAIVAGAGLVAVRFVWESFVWIIPYSIFWVWVIALSIRLLARPALRPEPEQISDP